MTVSYGFSKDTNLTFDQAVVRVTDELSKQGFGVLTTIDVKETMKKKLNVDFGRYVILGACNPPFAHKALTAEEEIGLLLPCNVVIYETEGKIRISAIDPTTMTKLSENRVIHEVAEQAATRLKSAIESV